LPPPAIRPENNFKIAVIEIPSGGIAATISSAVMGFGDSEPAVPVVIFEASKKPWLVNVQQVLKSKLFRLANMSGM
jgi:hypothetical protein